MICMTDQKSILHHGERPLLGVQLQLTLKIEVECAHNEINRAPAAMT